MKIKVQSMILSESRVHNKSKRLLAKGQKGILRLNNSFLLRSPIFKRNIVSLMGTNIHSAKIKRLI